MRKDIQIIEVPSEIGAGTRGASLGIEAIKVAARNKGSKLFSNYVLEYVEEENEYLDEDLENPYGKYIKGVYKVADRLSKVVKDKLGEGKLPLILSGDHSMAHASISGIKAAYPDKRLGIVWIDAHADLHSPFTSPSGNMHGMPLAMSAAEDNLENKVNEPKEETLEYWEKLKNLRISGPKYDYNDLVFIGVRSTEPPERTIIEKHNILNITVDEVRSNGADHAIRRCQDHLMACDIVYVSFDVDSMDPSLSKGTGTPVENGLTHAEAIQLNQNLALWDKLCAWEMVEVNPTLDERNKMGELAFGVLEKVTESLEN